MINNIQVINIFQFCSIHLNRDKDIKIETRILLVNSKSVTQHILLDISINVLPILFGRKLQKSALESKRFVESVASLSVTDEFWGYLYLKFDGDDNGFYVVVFYNSVCSSCEPYEIRNPYKRNICADRRTAQKMTSNIMPLKSFRTTPLSIERTTYSRVLYFCNIFWLLVKFALDWNIRKYSYGMDHTKKVLKFQDTVLLLGKKNSFEGSAFDKTKYSKICKTWF